MKHQYESELIKEIVDTRGHKKSSLHYESECVKSWIEEAKGAYPKLCDYESEWLKYISILDDTGGEDPEPPIGEFPYVVLSDVTEATVDNVVPYAYKSATLKGNTLVNVINYDDVSLKNATRNDDGTYTLKHAQDVNTSFVIPKTTKKNLFKSNTKYLLAVNIIENNTGTVLGLSGINSPFVIDNKDINFENKLGWQFKIFTSKSDISVDDSGRPVYNYIYFGIWKDGGDLSTSIKFKFAIVEYQEGMENWDIPYFEGMKSVKMPVLTTSGVNVFSEDNRMEYGAWAINGPVSTTSEIRCKNKYTPFPKGLKNGDKMYIVLSDTSINSNTNMHVYDENKTYITPDKRGCIVSNFVNGVAVVSINDVAKCGYFSFRAISSNINCEFALMINDYAPYEPFKSIILTVNENVVLRGIGDVKDELDLLTGELTERIGEVVLDENTAKNFTLNAVYNNTVSFWCMHNASSPFVNISIGEDLKTLLCDKFPRKSIFNEDVELIHSGTGAVVLRILKSKLQTPDVNGLTLYLQSNPITVQYKLASESVRTVDLNIQDQNGKTLSVIKPIEGKMLLSTSSDTINPLFSGEIPVEAITQNLASFVDLD